MRVYLHRCPRDGWLAMFDPSIPSASPEPLRCACNTLMVWIGVVELKVRVTLP